ncbi:MAG: helix-turn-helix domain-containing protein, partial [Mycobacteriales bacterium]
LSQIERGLRKPSAEILQQIAKALRISAEALYVQAGILEHRPGNGLLADAVHADEGLSERQKQVLLEIYDSFRKENAAAQASSTEDAAVSLVTTSNELSTTSLPTPDSTTRPKKRKAASAPRTKPAKPATSAPAAEAEGPTASTEDAV